MRDLLAVVERDLADSAAEGISADWRMNIAYNAALQAERIGLVSDADAAAIRALACRVRDELVAWLEGHHPDLLD